MDIESLYNFIIRLISKHEILEGRCHTYLGALQTLIESGFEITYLLVVSFDVRGLLLTSLSDDSRSRDLYQPYLM